MLSSLKFLLRSDFKQNRYLRRSWFWKTKWPFVTFNELCVFLMLAYVEIFIEIGSWTNVVELKKLKSLSSGMTEFFLSDTDELTFLIRKYRKVFGCSNNHFASSIVQGQSHFAPLYICGLKYLENERWTRYISYYFDQYLIKTERENTPEL